MTLLLVQLEALPEAVPVPSQEKLALSLDIVVGVPEPVALGADVSDGVLDAEVDTDALPMLPQADDDAQELSREEIVAWKGLALCAPLTDNVTLALPVRLGVPVPLTALPLPVTLPLRVAIADPLPSPPARAPFAVMLPLDDTVAPKSEAVCRALLLELTEGLLLGQALVLAVAQGEGEKEGKVESEREAEGERVALTLLLTLRKGLPVAPSLIEPVSDCVLEAEGQIEGVADAQLPRSVALAHELALCATVCVPPPPARVGDALLVGKAAEGVDAAVPLRDTDAHPLLVALGAASLRLDEAEGKPAVALTHWLVDAQIEAEGEPEALRAVLLEGEIDALKDALRDAAGERLPDALREGLAVAEEHAVPNARDADGDLLTESVALEVKVVDEQADAQVLMEADGKAVGESKLLPQALPVLPRLRDPLAVPQREGEELAVDDALPL